MNPKEKFTKIILACFIGVIMTACGAPKPTEEHQATATLAPPTAMPTSEPTNTLTPEPTDTPTPASTDTPTPIPAQNYLEAGDTAYEAGDYERAIAAYDQAIAQDPELASAYGKRGNAYVELDAYEKAIADYDKAIELDPDNAQVHFQRAGILYDTGQPDEALDGLNQAIEIDPEYAMAYVIRSTLHMEMGDQEKALADMERALELNPKLAEAIQKVYEQIQAQGSEEGAGEMPFILQTYAHPDGVFTIDYPEDWTAMENEGVVMFTGAESMATGQVMMVMYGTTAQLFEGLGLETQTLLDAAKQIAASSWEGTGMDYEIVTEEPISEDRVYLSTATEAADDQRFVLDLYVDQAEEKAFVLLMMSMHDSDFHQAWETIVESYSIYPEVVP